jgi:hypothetical protein
MWLHNEFDVVDELVIGDCKWRLIESHINKKRTIQSWSTLSKQWNTVYRYKVPEHWEWWKNYAAKTTLQTKEYDDKRSIRKTNDVRGTKKVSRKKSTRKSVSK